MSFKDIFKKSFPIPHYNTVKFGQYANSDEQFKGANKHSWTIENISLKAVLSQFMINRMSLRNGMISRLTSIFFDWNCGLVVRKSPS